MVLMCVGNDKRWEKDWLKSACAGHHGWRSTEGVGVIAVDVFLVLMYSTWCCGCQNYCSRRLLGSVSCFCQTIHCRRRVTFSHHNLHSLIHPFTALFSYFLGYSCCSYSSSSLARFFSWLLAWQLLQTEWSEKQVGNKNMQIFNRRGARNFTFAPKFPKTENFQPKRWYFGRPFSSR